MTIKSKFNRGGPPSLTGSQFDSQQTLKLAFDDNLRSYRFHDSESPVFDRFETTLDGDNITKIVYYVADKHEKFELEITGDVAGSLSGQYFVVNSAYDKTSFYIWYNVDGTGVDPMIPNSVGIEIPLVINDVGELIAEATELFANANVEFNYIFDITREKEKLIILTKKEGPVSNNSIGTTPFILTPITTGSEIISEIYHFEYNSDCDITGMYKT